MGSKAGSQNVQLSVSDTISNKIVYLNKAQLGVFIRDLQKLDSHMVS